MPLAFRAALRFGGRLRLAARNAAGVYATNSLAGGVLPAVNASFKAFGRARAGVPRVKWVAPCDASRHEPPALRDAAVVAARYRVWRARSRGEPVRVVDLLLAGRPRCLLPGGSRNNPYASLVSAPLGAVNRRLQPPARALTLGAMLGLPLAAQGELNNERLI